MEDAVQALRAAIERMREAEATLPEDLAAELRGVVTRAEQALASIRAKAAEEG